jgi:hypothetical protein
VIDPVEFSPACATTASATVGVASTLASASSNRASRVRWPAITARGPVSMRSFRVVPS